MKKIPLIDVMEGLNILEVLGIFLTLLMAFVFQFVLNELPCPLCLLQRIGFFSMAFGFLLNLRFGLRPSHYALVILAALFTSFVALRQIALHVVPGTGTYGTPFLGLHLYTWSFIVSMCVIVFTTIFLGVDRQYQPPSTKNMHYPKLTHTLFVMMAILIIANIISLIVMCGFHECPENPTSYKLTTPNE